MTKTPDVGDLRERAKAEAEQRTAATLDHSCGIDWSRNSHRAGFEDGAAWQRDNTALPAPVVSGEAVIEFMHQRNEFDYDQCDHGTYTGGPSHGQPYTMCERQGRALLDFLAALGITVADTPEAGERA